MLINTLTLLVGIIGAALVAYGAWLVMPAAGYITGGALCLTWSCLVSRAAARQQPAGEEDS
ncbi:hypothetical protein [Halomonas elongata]|uniref:hypothetical protein n=1 Tax=Halomonas elongata TaxID=2746 RepID=UPI00186B8517|nr:hypothetical protein [Halomonas elongata]MBW5802037.1 hypothetical protein [Halomonas elongata]